VIRFLSVVCSALFSVTAAAAQETFDESVIESFLNESNPYVYTAVGQEYVSRARAEAAEGEFDTQLGLRYDNKQYPTSDGEFTDLFLEKPTESGVGFLVGYRKAEGVQEYNNIKTGDKGEMRLGVKIPVFAVAGGMNDRRFRLESASLDAVQSSYVARENLRHLRFDVYSAYYMLLYRKQAAELETELLDRAKQREAFVHVKVNVGDLPEIELLEMQRQVLNREQRLLEAENAYGIALENFLRYLAMSRDVFEARYELPPLPESRLKTLSYDTVIEQALESRPDLKALQYETQRLELRDDYNAISSLPKLNVALYGVHDFVYDNGFKISVDMDFPIERRRYHGQKSEIQKGKRAVQEALVRKRTEISTGLSNRLNTMRTLQANLQNAEKEITVAGKLEAAEIKRFELGAGDLMLVNQRELNTLEARLKKYSYRLRLLLSGLEVEREAGTVVGETGILAAQEASE